MPIYEYLCENGDKFDLIQSFSDEPLTQCEVCGAPVRRVMHAPAVHFKGNGFYSTDYARRSPSKSEDNGAPTKTASEGSSTETSSSSSEKPKGEKAPAKD